MKQYRSIDNISPRLGRPVLYVLNSQDVTGIIQRRRQAGLGTFAANEPRAGDVLPAIIVKDFGVYGPAREVYLDNAVESYVERAKGRDFDADRKTPEGYRDQIEASLDATDPSVNLQVFMDGNDTMWATSRSEFDPVKHGRWVQVIDGHDAELPQTLSPEDYMDEGIEFRADPEGHWIALS